MCGRECCIFFKSMHSSLLSWSDWYLKKSRISSKILKSEGLGKNKFRSVRLDTMHVSVRDLHENIVGTTKYGGLKEAIDKDDKNLYQWFYVAFTIATAILKNVVNIQGYVWLRMLHICQKYAFIITVMAILLFKKTQWYNPKCSKQKVWEKSKSYIWNL